MLNIAGNSFPNMIPMPVYNAEQMYKNFLELAELLYIF